MKSVVFLATLLTAVLVFQGCAVVQARAKGAKTATTAHIAHTPVKVESQNGAVQVIADAALKEVEIVAIVTCAGVSQKEADDRLAQAMLDIVRDTAGALTVRPVFPGSPRDGDGADVTVKLPDASGVDIETSNGLVAVTATAGTLTIDTSNGNIKVVNHRGPATIESSNGQIKIEQLGGALRATTSNGSVTASEIGGPAEIRTSNGRISLALNPDQSGPANLRSSNGSISVRVGPAFASVIRFEVSNGSINVQDPASRASSKQLSRRSGTMTVGAGGSDSTLETSNGSIEVVID